MAAAAHPTTPTGSKKAITRPAARPALTLQPIGLLKTLLCGTFMGVHDLGRLASTCCLFGGPRTPAPAYAEGEDGLWGQVAGLSLVEAAIRSRCCSCEGVAPPLLGCAPSRPAWRRLFHLAEATRGLLVRDGVLGTGPTDTPPPDDSFEKWASPHRELRVLVVPQRVTAIDANAFRGCSNLVTLHLPDGLAFIGVRAFMGCSGLTTLRLPNPLTTIGQWAFRGCSGLTTLTLSNTLTTIGGYAFNGCSGLTTLTLPNTLTTIGEWAFYGCSGLTSIDVPDGVTNIGWGAFEGCTGLGPARLSELQARCE